MHLRPATTYQPHIPVYLTLHQLAEGLRRLSRSELEMLDILLDRKAARAVKEVALKPSYVHKIRRRMKEPAPYKFTTPRAFLAQLHGK